MLRVWYHLIHIKKRGAALVSALMVLVVLSLVTAGFVEVMARDVRASNEYAEDQILRYTAEAGLEYAKWCVKHNMTFYPRYEYLAMDPATNGSLGGGGSNSGDLGPTAGDLAGGSASHAKIVDKVATTFGDLGGGGTTGDLGGGGTTGDLGGGGSSSGDLGGGGSSSGDLGGGGSSSGDLGGGGSSSGDLGGGGSSSGDLGGGISSGDLSVGGASAGDISSSNPPTLAGGERDLYGIGSIYNFWGGTEIFDKPNINLAGSATSYNSGTPRENAAARRRDYEYVYATDISFPGEGTRSEGNIWRLKGAGGARYMTTFTINMTHDDWGKGGWSSGDLTKPGREQAGIVSSTLKQKGAPVQITCTAKLWKLPSNWDGIKDKDNVRELETKQIQKWNCTLVGSRTLTTGFTSATNAVETPKLHSAADSGDNFVDYFSSFREWFR
ncbi:MAG: hypothetical protein K6A35_09670 [bacterium]|nr:hypothetical protein [bacterium]